LLQLTDSDFIETEQDRKQDIHIYNITTNGLMLTGYPEENVSFLQFSPNHDSCWFVSARWHAPKMYMNPGRQSFPIIFLIVLYVFDIDTQEMPSIDFHNYIKNGLCRNFFIRSCDLLLNYKSSSISKNISEADHLKLFSSRTKIFFPFFTFFAFVTYIIFL